MVVVGVIIWVISSLIFWGTWNYTIGPIASSAGVTSPTGTISCAVAFVFMVMVFALYSPLIISMLFVAGTSHSLTNMLDEKSRKHHMTSYDAWRATSPVAPAK